MKRGLVVILSAAVLVAAVIAVVRYRTQGVDTSVLILRTAEGMVTVSGAPIGEITGGITIRENDTLKTGLDSRAVVAMGDQSELELGPVASIRVTAIEDNEVSIELDSGAVQAVVRPGSRALRLAHDQREVLTTDASLSMGVGADGTLMVQASEGRLMVAGVAGLSELEKGQRLTVGSQQDVNVGPIPDDLFLTVHWPGQVRTRKDSAMVLGKTEPASNIRIIGGTEPQVLKADGRGHFEAEVSLWEGDNRLQVQVTDILGNENNASATVTRDTTGPNFRGGVKYDRP